MSKFSMNAASARSGKMMVMGKSLSIHTNASKIHQARVMYEGLTKVSNINNIWPACARWPSKTDRSCSEPVWHLDSKIRYWLLQKKPHHQKNWRRKKNGGSLRLIPPRTYETTAIWSVVPAWPCIQVALLGTVDKIKSVFILVQLQTQFWKASESIWKCFFISSYLLKYMPSY